MELILLEEITKPKQCLSGFTGVYASVAVKKIVMISFSFAFDCSGIFPISPDIARQGQVLTDNLRQESIIRLCDTYWGPAYQKKTLLCLCR